MKRRTFVKAAGAALGASAMGMLSRPAYAQQKTIELWSLSPAGDTTVVERAIANVVNTFQAANPDITVKITTMPWQELSPALLRAAATRRGPDVAMVYSPQMPVQTDAGAVQSLDPFMEAWSEEDRADIIRLPQSMKGGETFGLSWQMRTSGLIHRADLLTETGRAAPTTLGEWAEFGTALAEGERVGTAFGFSPVGSSIAGAWFLTTQLGMGANPIGDDGKANFNTPEAQQIAEWVFEQVHGATPPNLPLDVAMLDQEKAHDLFIAKRAVFLPTSSDRHARVTSQSGLVNGEVGMTMYPTFDAAKPAPAVVQSWSLVMPVAAPQPELAWKFIEHWTSREQAIAGAKIAGFGPGRSSALTDPFFASPEGAILRWSTQYPAEHPFTFQFPTHTEVLYDTWAKMFGRILNRQSSITDALTWASGEYDRRVS